MVLCISRQQYEQLLKWASDAGQRECCGLILGRGNRVEELVLCDNVAAQPARHFEIDPVTLIIAEKAARTGGLAILGYFHSHPNGLAQPSATDADMAAADGRYWIVLTADAATAWRAVADASLYQRFNPVRLIFDDNARG